jgi:hypothetical protein
MQTLKPKKQTVTFPKEKISFAVKTALPKGKFFKLHVVDSKIDKMKIVRVVTPAWKSLPPAVRIGRVIKAINTELTPREQKGILRFSVLTPEEYAETVTRRPYKKLAPTR